MVINSLDKILSIFQKYLDGEAEVIAVSDQYFSYIKNNIRPLESENVVLTNKQGLIKDELLSLFTYFDIFENGVSPEDENLFKEKLKESIKVIKANL